MRLFVISVALVLLGAIEAKAQTVTIWGNELLEYNISNTNSAAEAAMAKHYVYVDANPKLQLLATCTGTVAPWICRAPVPSMNPAQHSLQLSIALTSSLGVEMESPKSTPLVLTRLAQPVAPNNAKVVPGP